MRKSIGTAIGANAEEVRAFLNQIDAMVSLLCDLHGDLSEGGGIPPALQNADNLSGAERRIGLF
ncbi:MAG: hypothetical protein ACLR23_12130 [Clostridia bacterium]